MGKQIRRLESAPELKSREPIADPLRSVIEEVLRHVRIRRGGQRAVGARRYARGSALDDDKIFVLAIGIQIIDLDLLDQILKRRLISGGKQRRFYLLKHARRRIVAGTKIDLVFVH